MQPMIDKAILASRYILVVFYVGLGLALLVYAARFLMKLWAYAAGLFTADDTDHLIQLLHLLDSALVAALVVMVALSSYDSLVSRLTADDLEDDKPSWVRSVDPGNLKIKLSTALIAISSIQLLQIFMEVDNYSDRAVSWALAIHAAFLLGAVVLGVLDKLTAKRGESKL